MAAAANDPLLSVEKTSTENSEEMTTEVDSAPVVNVSYGSGGGWFDWLPAWKPTSEKQLVDAEKAILDNLTTEFKHLHVPVGPDVFIHTIVFDPETPPPEPAIPLVMVHGFGCGIPQFYKNYDHLHSTRRLYSIDLPGYARSTRVQFTDNPEQNEDLFINYLEQWRLALGLERFILLGHSFGGYICSAYTIRHPDRVRHLILDDPWGLLSRTEQSGERKFPIYITLIAAVVTKFRPFDGVRIAGPAGPYLVKKFRADLVRIFGESFMNYVYHSNAQDPTGEQAFFTMQFQYGWSLRPMLTRISSDLPASCPMTLIYGTRSWLDNSTGSRLKEARPCSFVDIHYVKKAGHHLHVEQPEEFNRIVNHTCSLVDRNEDTPPVLDPHPDRTVDSTANEESG